MKAKRKTKAQKEAEARQLLRNRVSDIASGTCGRDMDNEDEWITLSEAAILIPALLSRFEQLERYTHMTSLHNLNYYESVNSIFKFFWRNGIRA